VCSLTRRSEDVQVAKTAVSERESIRLGIPSKGRMAEETLQLLSTCQLKCVKPNPRQYYGQIPHFPELEVWFQRASDVVRKLRTCDLDLGIVGTDMFAEFAAEDNDLVIVHDALAFGHCKLALGVPNAGDFADITTVEDLKGMGWSEARPLRVVTAYMNIAERCEHSKR
jgi:ATP phosphoribosyltransferase